jgi:hypothetical protein
VTILGIAEWRYRLYRCFLCYSFGYFVALKFFKNKMLETKQTGARTLRKTLKAIVRTTSPSRATIH